MFRPFSSDRSSLEALLRKSSGPGVLFREIQPGIVQCHACSHRCAIREGDSGICQVRFNEKGVLRVPRGYVSGLQVDPIEKKPFYHVLPGRNALSFGMLGCNFHCDFCQNWQTAHTLQNPQAGFEPEAIEAEAVAASAVQSGAPIIASTYNEPVITAEWAVEILKQAHPHGIRGAFVSNGHATPELLEFIRPFVPFYKVDLKCFREETYRRLGGKLAAVKETIRHLHKMNFWVEVVTLVVPDVSDDPEELKALAGFIASISPDIPWHVTAYHRVHGATGPDRTPPEAVLGAAGIGRAEGLHYVYVGNLPEVTPEFRNTLCRECGKTLVERKGMGTRTVRIEKGACPDCGSLIPGVWE